MKQLIITAAILLAILCVGCRETSDVNAIDYHKPLAGFLSTRASDPLDGTVWMADSDEEFHRMLLFSDGCVNLFYGLIENGEMQRWSEYYSAPYALSNDATVVTTNLVYPIFGTHECAELLMVMKSEDMFTIITDLDTFDYIGHYNASLDERWTLVYTTIQPWGED